MDGWFAESSESPEGADAGDDGSTSSETQTGETAGDSEGSGSDEEDATLLQNLGSWLEDMMASDWPFESGLSFWSAFWIMGLVSLVFMSMSFVIKLLGREDRTEDKLVSLFLFYSAVVSALILWVAIEIGEGFANTALMVGAALLRTLIWIVVGFAVLGAMYPGSSPSDPPTQE